MDPKTPIRFKSSAQWNGIPFVDIAIGPDASHGERRGGDTYRTSVEILFRLLQSDRYYGLRQVQN